jgi:putative sigma-54 modulation protein
MNIKITGKEVKATEAIKQYLAKKLERIEKYFEDELDATLTIRVEGKEQIAEISVVVKGDMFRAVTEDKDLYASIDKDMDILEGQIRKWKTKREKQNKEESIKQKNSLNMMDKPMSAEDAKLKMQEKPKYQFLTFINSETNKVNVIYKLKDGKNYGIVEPEA